MTGRACALATDGLEGLYGGANHRESCAVVDAICCYWAKGARKDDRPTVVAGS